MNAQQLMDLAHQFLPADLWNKLVLATGYLTLVTQAVPLLLSWGTPAATKAADAVAKALLNSPLRPVVIYAMPRIVAFLDAFAAAIVHLVNTFKGELEADLTAAAAADAKKAETPATTVEKPGAASGA